jgi:hypothetical protein
LRKKKSGPASISERNCRRDSLSSSAIRFSRDSDSSSSRTRRLIFASSSGNGYFVFSSSFMSLDFPSPPGR